MGKIIFIGLGLHDDRSLTLEALGAGRRCDFLFAEQYTSILSPGSLESISRELDRGICVLSREEVEGGEFLESARNKTVGFLVPGDPMTATTHVDLRIRAHSLGMTSAIVHGTSALTSVPGILGLQHYKFGRTVTIPFPEKGFEPTSPLELLLENLDRGLHTLALLDIRADEGRYMRANEGLNWLLSAAEQFGAEGLSGESLGCVVARAGSESCLARADRIQTLVEIDFGPPLHTIVVPGKLHFAEAEALRLFAGAPEKILSID